MMEDLLAMIVMEKIQVNVMMLMMVLMVMMVIHLQKRC